jgi:hypothetical protein
VPRDRTTPWGTMQREGRWATMDRRGERDDYLLSVTDETDRTVSTSIVSWQELNQLMGYVAQERRRRAEAGRP